MQRKGSVKYIHNAKSNKNDEFYTVLSDIEKELKGNIATDEFAYNLDLILLPIWIKADNAQFLDYHIYNNEKIPHFERDAVGEIIHEAQRRAGRKGKLSLRLRELGCCNSPTGQQHEAIVRR